LNGSLLLVEFWPLMGNYSEIVKKNMTAKTKPIGTGKCDVNLGIFQFCGRKFNCILMTID